MKPISGVSVPDTVTGGGLTITCDRAAGISRKKKKLTMNDYFAWCGINSH